MKIKNQFLVSIIIFSIIIALFTTFVFVAQQQKSQLNSQEALSRDIQNHANNLVYLSSDYFLYHDSSALTQWKTEFSSLSDSLSKVSVSSPEQQTLLNKINDDAQQLNESWTVVALYLESTPLNVTVRNIPVFQADWSIMSAQNQALIFDAQQQSQAFHTEIDQLNLTTILLIFALLGLFGAYFITNYLITYRNTLKSISELQDGITVIGSGNLDYSLTLDRKDEIADISRSINQMATNLKTVTASKVDLEKEIVERKKAEEDLSQAQAKLQEYANNLEKLVEERTKQLKDSERLAAIGATAGMVGHDIRNPLQAITSDVYLAKTELAYVPESEEKKNALESMVEIEKNVDYINKIVQDLQDYARPLNPKIEESDLKSIIETFIAKNGLPQNITVNVKITDEARRIRADSYFLKRILFNLVTNAVQAMPNGGKLTIGAHREAADTILTVEDTGVGIPKEIQDKMFTLMFTTKSKGQGFGLPVVKRLTESLGGKVTFESQEGKGTTFIVSLPPPKELKR